MTVDEIIQKAFLHAQGKSTPPASGTTKYNNLINIVDSMQKLWAHEPAVDYWDSLYELRTLAVPASETDTIALDADIDKLAVREEDPIRIGTSTFKVVRPNQLYEYRTANVCARSGNTLKFSHDLDAILDGEAIQVPVTVKVADITTGEDIVAVDDPMWLAYISAAEFVRNNIVKSSQYNNLLALADQSMQRMMANNGGVTLPWSPAGETWS